MSRRGGLGLAPPSIPRMWPGALPTRRAGAGEPSPALHQVTVGRLAQPPLPCLGSVEASLKPATPSAPACPPHRRPVAASWERAPDCCRAVLQIVLPHGLPPPLHNDATAAPDLLAYYPPAKVMAKRTRLSVNPRGRCTTQYRRVGRRTQLPSLPAVLRREPAS